MTDNKYGKIMTFRCPIKIAEVVEEAAIFYGSKAKAIAKLVEYGIGYYLNEKYEKENDE